MVMASTTGQAARVVVGIALIVVGGLLGRGWWALAIVGLVPLAASTLDVCLFNVLLPTAGTLRARKNLLIRFGQFLAINAKMLKIIRKEHR